jgi:signal transduction histidine kinase
LESQSCEREFDVYYSTLVSVCRALKWDIGHVLVPQVSSPHRFVSAGLWECNAPELFKDFEIATRNTSFGHGDGLPGTILKSRRVELLSDAGVAPCFLRKSAIPQGVSLMAVAGPILIEGEVVAILEFFTRTTSAPPQNIKRFSELLTFQLGSAISRLRAAAREKQQLAGIAHAGKMATLGEIAAGVAHEINNPLHTLTLISHLLKRTAQGGMLTSELLASQLTKVETCVQRMAHIVSGLKDFSRDAAYDSYQSTKLKALIDETLDLCHSRLMSKVVRVIITRFPSDWAIECRRSQISQVILNLLNNAYDAVGELDKRWIRIEVVEAGAYFEISVTDSGTGIPAEVAKKIMTPFFTTKPTGKGTGLGLSISSNIMTDHGGSLSLDPSSPNTRFVIRVPNPQAAQPSSAEHDTAHRKIPEQIDS